MKTYALITGIAIAVLNGLALVPALQPYFPYFLAASLAFALWLVAKTLTTRDESRSPAAKEAPAETSTAKPQPPAAKHAEAEIVTLLGIFQEKGRLIDFLMDDITAYSDAQVGAAARVVHQGCRGALSEHFEVRPVSDKKEGSRVEVPEGEAGAEYRLVGKVQGEPPFSGLLVHKGWKAGHVKLPRVLNLESGRLPPIAPAQVELK